MSFPEVPSGVGVQGGDTEGGKGLCDRGLWQQLPKELREGCLPRSVRILCQLTLASSTLSSFSLQQSQNYITIGFFLRSGAAGAVWNKNAEAFPAPRWPLSEAQPLRQDTERGLACVVVLVSLCSQSCVHRVKQGSSSLPSSSSGESCVLGRWAEDTKEKEMWEDSGWPDHGGWDARNTIIHTKKGHK